MPGETNAMIPNRSMKMPRSSTSHHTALAVDSTFVFMRLGSPDSIGVRRTTSSSLSRRIREVADPAERRQRGHEEVLAAAEDVERVDVVDAAPHRIPGDREGRPLLL